MCSAARHRHAHVVQVLDKAITKCVLLEATLPAHVIQALVDTIIECMLLKAIIASSRVPTSS